MPKGSRNRKVWSCPPCHKKLFSRRAWASHLWDAHQLALPLKVRFPKKEMNDGARAP